MTLVREMQVGGKYGAHDEEILDVQVVPERYVVLCVRTEAGFKELRTYDWDASFYRYTEPVREITIPGSTQVHGSVRLDRMRGDVRVGVMNPHTGWRVMYQTVNGDELVAALHKLGFGEGGHQS